MKFLSSADARLFFQKELGKRLRAARKIRGLTQVTLARLSALHPSHISKIERGEANVSLSSLLAITMALEINLFGSLQNIPLPAAPDDSPNTHANPAPPLEQN